MNTDVSHEHQIAIREARLNVSEKEYFATYPKFDNVQNRRLFYDGLWKGYDAALQPGIAPSPARHFDSLQMADLWIEFSRSSACQQSLEWVQTKDFPGALFVAFRAGCEVNKNISPTPAPQPVIKPAWAMLTVQEIRDICGEGNMIAVVGFAQAIQTAFIAKQGCAA